MRKETTDRTNEDDDADIFERLVSQFYRRYFSPRQSANISDVAVIGEIALQAGLHDKVIRRAIEQLHTEAYKEKLKENCGQVTKLGGFGLPLTVVHSGRQPGQCVYGSDRMHIIGHLLGQDYSHHPPV